MRHDTKKLLEETICKTFSDINCTNVFLSQSPKAREIKYIIISKWDLVKLTSSMRSKGNHKKISKRQSTEWEKIFANDVTDKGLISKIYKQLTQLNDNNQKTT